MLFPLFQNHNTFLVSFSNVVGLFSGLVDVWKHVEVGLGLFPTDFPSPFLGNVNVIICILFNCILYVRFFYQGLSDFYTNPPLGIIFGLGGGLMLGHRRSAGNVEAIFRCHKAASLVKPPCRNNNILFCKGSKRLQKGRF
jgi:hypothetical protein